MSQPPDVIFRPADSSEIPRILPLMAGFYAYGGMRFDADVATEALRKLFAEPALGKLWIFEEAGAPVGYLVVAFGFSLEFGGRDAFVDELYVEDSYRGAGIGKRALALAEQTCREQGVHALHLEVDETDGRAQQFYAKAGFRSRLAESRNYLMTKRL